MWALVSGFMPSNVQRGLMVFQAAIDDSVADGATFVYGGYIATAEVWAKVALDWEKLLPLTYRNKTTGNHRFKMAEMAPRRMNDVPAFYAIIEKYDLLRLYCQFDISDLKRAQDRIWVEDLNLNWGWTANPHALGFRLLMDMFHNNRALLDKVIPCGEKVDFYFDKRGEKKAIDEMWEDYLRERPEEVRKYYSEAGPKFEDDEEFLPLQAADFFAWWVRKWIHGGTPEKIGIEDFGPWKASKSPRGMAISFGEDELVEALISLMVTRLGPYRPIFDAKFYPRPVLAEPKPGTTRKPFWKRLFS
jgi:hypothetical protein